MMSTARVLFVAVGVFWALIGVLTGVLTDRGIGPPMLFISERTDTALFGASPDEVIGSNPQLTTFRYMVIRALAGLLVAVGGLTAGLAWFGLTEPRRWVLATLTVLGLAVLPYWWSTLGPYRDAGIRVRLGDIPPFMWVPAIVMPIASIAGWMRLTH